MKKCKFISGQEYNGDQENIKSGRKFHHEGNFLHGKILKKISENYIQKDHTEMLAKEELQQFLKSMRRKMNG